MIRRIVPGILVFGLIAGLSGTLAGHLWKSYSQQTFRIWFWCGLRALFRSVCQNCGRCIRPRRRTCDLRSASVSI